MKLQFGFPQHRSPRETHRGAGAVRHSNCGAKIFQPLLAPHLLPQELQRYDPLDVMLQPLIPGSMARPRTVPAARVTPSSIHGMPSAVLPEALRAQPRRIPPTDSQCAKFRPVESLIKSDAKRSASAGLRSFAAKPAAPRECFG
jgi:hypothetical protein